MKGAGRKKADPSHLVIEPGEGFRGAVFVEVLRPPLVEVRDELVCPSSGGVASFLRSPVVVQLQISTKVGVTTFWVEIADLSSSTTAVAANPKPRRQAILWRVRVLRPPKL